MKRWAVWLGLLLAGWAGAARAAEVYTVPNVMVDATAASANQARDTALSQGLTQALGTLFDRLVLSADRAKLPPVTPQLAGPLLASLDIVSEKTSTTRYLATVNISFKKPAVQALLQRAQVSFSDAGGRRFLVVPTAPADQMAAWQAAWAKTLAGPTGVAAQLPKDGETDPALTQAQAGSVDAARTLARQYGLDDAVLAVLQPGADPQSWRVALQPTDAGADISLTDPVNAGDAMAAGAAAALTAMGDQIKGRSLVNLSVRNELTVTVPLASFADWTAIQDRLRRVTGLQKMTVQRLSVQQAVLAISFLGEPPQFANLCAQAGLSLKEQDGGWVLGLPGV